MFGYDGIDRETSFEAPQIGAEIFRSTRTFNPDGEQTRAVLGDGRIIDFVYDATTGQLTQVIAPDGITAYAYDPISTELGAVTSPDGVTVSYTRDGALITNVEFCGEISASVTRTFDNDFRRASDDVSGTGTVEYAYDADGLLVQAGPLALTHRADNGLPETTTLGSISDLRTFDEYAEEVAYTASHGASALYSATYARDALGRITEKTETIAGSTHHLIYHYDLGDRLEQVDRDGVVAEHYTYGTNNNRLSAEVGGGVVAAAYDEQDRLTHYGDLSFTYNAAGQLSSKLNTVSSEATGFEYDVRGNLKQVIQADGRIVDYLVDGWNRRVAKIVDGQLARGYVWDGPQLVAELDANQDVVARFVYATHGHVPDYFTRNGVTYRIITDQLGSPRLVVDTQTGAISQRIEYDSFGRVSVDTQPGFQPFGFAGGLYDPDTGLVRFGARDYDAELGRWTARDPTGFGDRLNLYEYGRSDPLNRIDPDGRVSLLVAIVAVIIVVDAIDIHFQLHENGGDWSALDSHRASDAISLGLGVGIGVEVLATYARWMCQREGVSALSDAARAEGQILSNRDAGKIIGWPTGQAAAGRTAEMARTLTAEQVAAMRAQGLNRATVEDLRATYQNAIEVGGAKLRNEQLLPRVQLMDRILELWPK